MVHRTCLWAENLSKYSISRLLCGMNSVQTCCEGLNWTASSLCCLDVSTLCHRQIMTESVGCFSTCWMFTMVVHCSCIYSFEKVGIFCSVDVDNRLVQVICDVTCYSVTDLESRLGSTFHQANTKRPEEITLREELPRKSIFETIDDFGLSLFKLYINFVTSISMCLASSCRILRTPQCLLMSYYPLTAVSDLWCLLC